MVPASAAPLLELETQLPATHARPTPQPPGQVGVTVPEQTPDLHAWPAPQSVPQPPQLAGSMSVLVQSEEAPLPQWLGSFAGQLQTPLAQLSPAGQSAPPSREAQVPQFCGSVWKLVQKPALPLPQWFGSAEGHAHAPALHDSPPGQTAPPSPAQLPQLFGSLCGFVHCPPHSCSPATQLTAQTPLPLQISPAGQAPEQPPQWSESVLKLVQNADAPLPQRFGSAAGHEQTPPLQLWPSAHATPLPTPEPMAQPPQLSGSVSGLLQSPLQSSCPARQEGAHWPAPLQRSPAGQTAPPLPAHAPQLNESLLVLVQNVALPLPQSVGAEFGHWHAPATQLSPIAQTLPPLFAQPPQFCGSVRRLVQNAALPLPHESGSAFGQAQLP